MILAERSKTKRERAQRAKERAERKATKARLLDLKPRKYWIAALKRSMHLYVRLRDHGKSCISCPRPLISAGKIGGDYDAGHYRSVGSAKHLEFDERNVHGQCKFCNDHLSGNHVGYRLGLVERIGEAAVQALEADQTDRKYTIEELKAKKERYDRLIKEIRRERAED